MSDDLNGGDLLNPPDNGNNKKKILFAIVCMVVIGVGGFLIYQKNFAQKPEPIATDNIAAIDKDTPVGSSSSGLGKIFHFKNDEPPPPKPTVSDTKSAPVDDKKQTTETTAETPPPPPNPKAATDNNTKPVTKRTITLNKSAASSSDGGAEPSQRPSQRENIDTTDSFKVFADGSSEQERDNSSLSSKLQSTQTNTALAAVLYNRDYLLAKGAYIDCVLNTKLDSTVPGMTKCTLTRNVYSDNGTTLLLERGSEVTGEYRANISQGQSRLFVLWDRVKTPNGVVISLSSPATDSLGAGGVSGYTDTHFWKRFGGAMMLSLVDDLAAYAATNGGKNTNNFENSSEAAQNMATEALKNTINIPPTFYKNQGERVGIFVARDLDFSSVYQLKVRIRR
ncbi:type IV secretion system protein VirB10 [Photobacterium damselae]|uniref:type IV secretion system protein VirB10 n=1 Tax=Photobacterium damselae TaxID=38293 RepID=UPI00165E0C3F|nr:type IV secretion system protein VirB10 [Photobacterium damselae]